MLAGALTSLALIELLENLSTSIDSKNITVGVFIDLKRSFDIINHSILIRKLEFYEIRGKALSWVKSYLDNRKQYVHFDGVNSSLLKILCGVPQGSILGPKLFILYINDICNVSKILKFILVFLPWWSHPQSWITDLERPSTFI